MDDYNRINYMKCGYSTVGIRDDELYKNWDSDFIAYLREKGFSNWGRKGYFLNTKVLYVNLNSKRFAFSWPGVKFTDPIAHKYISIEDFKKIYEIFEKYD